MRTLIATLVAAMLSGTGVEPTCLPSTQVRGLSGSGLGQHIVVGDQVVFASAHRDDQYGANAGAIYRLRDDDDDGWEIFGDLHPQDPWPQDNFSLGGLDFDGERIAVGTWTEWILGLFSGSVVVFEPDGAWWTPGPKIFPHDGWENHRFGWAVALRGDLLVVGAPGHDCGVVYVYRHGDDGWTYEASLTAASPPCFAGFWGRTVAIVNDCIVGAGGGLPVRTFLRDESGWVPDEGPLDDSVRAAAVDGDRARLAVGSPGTAPGEGRAYVFRREGAAWIQEALLQPPADEIGFGFDVAIDGDDLIVGSRGAGDDRKLGYVYRGHDGTWTLDLTIEAPVEDTSVFGDSRSLGIRGDEAFIGDESTSTVHVFDLADRDCDGNGIRDGCDIGAGMPDVDGNGVPDACDCLADLIGVDQSVNNLDLLILLSRWDETYSAGSADINRDGRVGFEDLLLLLAAWGPCPFPTP